MELSHSSANLLRQCESKFVYYKSNVLPDPDADNDTTALDVGSAFHYVLEKSLYTRKDIKPHLIEANKTYKLQENLPLVHAMVLKYLEVHEKSKFKVLQVELPIQNANIVGYIDIIEQDADGFWYISDLKTTSYISQDLYIKVLRDPQLFIYASFAKSIATQFELPYKKFKGMLYKAVAKPKFTRKTGELYLDFVKRLTAAVKVEHIFVEPNPKVIEETIAEHLRLKELGEYLLAGKAKPTRNYSSCFDWFKPCPYISKCYGATHSKIIEKYRGGNNE